MSSLCTIVVVLAAFLCAAAFGIPIDDAVAEVPAPIPIAPAAEKENYRLPTAIMPSAYNLTLHPYLLETDGAKRFTFDGEATIEIVPEVDTKTISMHTKNLNYTKRECWSQENVNTTTELVEFKIDEDTDIITYTLNETLTANKTYFLHFIYNGTMDDDMHGFYRSSYLDKDKKEKWIGSTQFQTNHARRAFPAFDEPRYKAVFTLEIVHDKNFTTVSNTPQLKSNDSDGDNVIDYYTPTPKMSTYLLAFIVSEFEPQKNDIFGVLARPEYKNQTEFSFDFGQKSLDYLSEYLDLDYYNMGIPKMDMAAIPDFSAGAMENWGLLTYRERSLLYVLGETTLSSKQSISAVIVHEQAHMWFGDLVTCEWWSYTWLNEGFATYFQYFGTNAVDTSLEMDKQFVVAQLQPVMTMDSTNSTNPLSDLNTFTPSDLSRMFNSISYNKGGTFIRMVKHVMGEDNFKNALREYLKKYSYQNTVPSNLFDIWKAHFPENFKDNADALFKSFTEQVGYPVINVDTSNSKAPTFKQKRFLLKSDDGANAALLYTVPITYTHSEEKDFTSTTPKFFLGATTNAHTENITASPKWLIANIQETGYYRVNYNEQNWRAIRTALHEEKWAGIHELNRAQLVDDLFNLARSSEITYELALEILEYLETEINYLPWTSAFNGLSYLSIRLGTDMEHFSFYIRKITEKVYKELGFDKKSTDGTLEIFTRAKVLSWSCRYGNSDCKAEARKHFDTINTKNIPEDIRSVVYCVSMREGNDTDFNLLFERYNTTTVSTEETLILNNLGCVKTQSLIEKFFKIILSNDVRRQDKSSALTTLYTENNENITPVFKLVTENFEELAKAMGGYSSVASVISSIASRFTEESQQKSLTEFNTNNKSKFGTSAATLEAAEKTVTENLLWSKQKLGAFKTYLEKVAKGGASRTKLTSLSLVLLAAIAFLLR